MIDLKYLKDNLMYYILLLLLDYCYDTIYFLDSIYFNFVNLKIAKTFLNNNSDNR